MTKTPAGIEQYEAFEIETWYDRIQRLWVVMIIDQDGNQMAPAEVVAKSGIAQAQRFCKHRIDTRDLPYAD